MKLKSLKYFLPILSLFAFSPAFVSIAAADIYNCNGKWQNKPCEGGAPAQTIEEETRGSDSDLPLDSRPTFVPKRPEDVKNQRDKAGEKNSGIKAEAGDAGGKCPQGKTFETDRPKPTLDFKYDQRDSGKASGKLTVSGSVNGHGSVKIALTMSVPGKGDDRTAWSKNFTLPDDGGDADFSKTVDVPIGANYNLTATNIGSFDGYCAGPATGKKKDEE